jgi:hypothetical protein
MKIYNRFEELKSQNPVVAFLLLYTLLFIFFVIISYLIGFAVRDFTLSAILSISGLISAVYLSYKEIWGDGI